MAWSSFKCREILPLLTKKLTWTRYLEEIRKPTEIADELVVNQDKVKEDFKDVGAIALKKGFHPVSIHFMEGIGRERLRLYFKTTYDHQWEELEVKGRFFH